MSLSQNIINVSQLPRAASGCDEFARHKKPALRLQLVRDNLHSLLLGRLHGDFFVAPEDGGLRRVSLAGLRESGKR